MERYNKHFSKFKSWLICLTALCLGACSSMAIVPVAFNITATNNINSYEHESALPVRLRIYQLADLNQFKGATFRELWKMDKQILGDSFVSMKEITVTPGLKNKLKISRQDKTNYIGIIAIFRHPELGKWRAYTKVSSQASSLLTSMSVSLNGNSVSLK